MDLGAHVKFKVNLGDFMSDMEVLLLQAKKLHWELYENQSDMDVESKNVFIAREVELTAKVYRAMMEKYLIIDPNEDEDGKVESRLTDLVEGIAETLPDPVYVYSRDNLRWENRYDREE